MQEGGVDTCKNNQKRDGPNTEDHRDIKDELEWTTVTDVTPDAVHTIIEFLESRGCPHPADVSATLRHCDGCRFVECQWICLAFNRRPGRGCRVSGEIVSRVEQHAGGKLAFLQ